MKTLLVLCGVAALASPIAPLGCATVGVGVTYKGKHGDYQLIRTSVAGQPPRWDVLVDVNGKAVVPFQ